MNNIIEIYTHTNNSQIETHKFNTFNNVLSYSYPVCIPKCTITINLNEVSMYNKEYYYIFDCPGEDAFAHFVFESFIFYPILIKLNELYPNIKILTKNSKKYLKNLLNFVNVSNEIVSCISSPNNTCFFSPVISLNSLLDVSTFQRYLHEYIAYIHTKLTDNVKYNITFFPRNKVDNYKPNDRIIYGTEDIIHNLVNMGENIVDTYELDNIGKQFNILNNSNIIIVDFGSNFFVNCIFLKNKKIIVLDMYNWKNSQVDSGQYISCIILYNIIQSNNFVHIINPIRENNALLFDDIKHLL